MKPGGIVGCRYGFQAFFRDLCSCLTPAALDIELVYRAYAISSGQERIPGFVEANTEGADTAGCDHCDPSICHVRLVKSHKMLDLALRNSYCFLNRSTLTITPKPKTKAWKLEDCQLSLFSGDSIRKSEQ